MDKKDRVRVDLMPKGIAKITKTTIVKAVERIVNEKQFELKIPAREFIEFASKNIHCTWVQKDKGPEVTVELRYTDPRLYPPVITEPRVLHPRVRFRIESDGNLRWLDCMPGRGISLDEIVANVLERVEIYVKDNRECIDIFI